MREEALKVPNTEPRGAPSVTQSVIHSAVKCRVAFPLSPGRRVSRDLSLALRRQDGKLNPLHLPGAIEGYF